MKQSSTRRTTAATVLNTNVKSFIWMTWFHHHRRHLLRHRRLLHLLLRRLRVRTGRFRLLCLTKHFRSQKKSW